MPALKLSNKSRQTPIPIIESRIPKPDELIVLNRSLLTGTLTIGRLLKDCTNKWALGGDVAEIISGVNVHPDHIKILTTRKGCDEITRRLADYQVEAPVEIEKRLDREANVDSKFYPVHVKSYTARFKIEDSKLEVHGDLQIKVGNWEWGDPLDYEPDYVYVVDVKMPVVPLQMKSDLYSGLGWMDRVTKIHEAVIRSRHKFG